jgi:2-polyprenyl-3-methyl-5-hydroxy-6-metoxy-1,4-benzoquinol methylase
MLQRAPVTAPQSAPATSARSLEQPVPACAACGGTLSERPLVRAPDRLLGTPGIFEVRECTRCGGGFTLPEASPEEISSYYPDSYAPYDLPTRRIERTISAAIQRYQRWRSVRRPPLEVLRTLPPGRALDVGCGRGDLGAMLIARGWHVTGIDPSESACATARSRGVDARTGTLADVALEPGSYDAAVFLHSLEHLTDPVQDLRLTANALRPGGYVLITVPNFGCWQRRRFGTRWFALDLPRHRVHFNSSALAHALERAGFELVGTSTSTSPISLPASVQYALFGRCLFPSGLALRVALGLCVFAVPFARVADRIGGGGDFLHAVARLPHGP